PRSGRWRATHNHLSRSRNSSASRLWRSWHSCSRLEQRNGSVQHLVAEHPANGCLSLQHRRLGFQPPENGQPPIGYFFLPVVPHPRIANPRPSCEWLPNVVTASRRYPRDALLGDSSACAGRSIEFNRAPVRILRSDEGALPVDLIGHS